MRKLDFSESEANGMSSGTCVMLRRRHSDNLLHVSRSPLATSALRAAVDRDLTPLRNLFKPREQRYPNSAGSPQVSAVCIHNIYLESILYLSSPPSKQVLCPIQSRTQTGISYSSSSPNHSTSRCLRRKKPVSGRVEPPVTQVPTPPVRGLHAQVILNITGHIFQESFTASPVDPAPDENALVSVSTTFFPGAQNHALPPDLVLLSADSVFFYVHIHVLLAASDNTFNSLLPPSTKAKSSPIGSHILNIVLHAVYDISCSHYSPSFESLAAALNAMTTYGISLRTHVAPTTCIHTLLLSLAPIYPLELYALAASYDLYDLAVPTSAYLLSFSLASLTDEMAERIGPKYLKRLFFLHFGRADALKRLLLPPPHPHPPTPPCDYSEQKKLTRAWALASAYLTWDARPGKEL
ncbi:hypothetical protein J3R82DRAFT_4380 [Butyriboletus roseoflavus]|nr:hypothetical protein J3R82DRAFT_4380 [Butyriboletus roseoflavus]